MDACLSELKFTLTNTPIIIWTQSSGYLPQQPSDLGSSARSVILSMARSLPRYLPAGNREQAPFLLACLLFQQEQKPQVCRFIPGDFGNFCMKLILNDSYLKPGMDGIADIRMLCGDDGKN